VTETNKLCAYLEVVAMHNFFLLILLFMYGTVLVIVRSDLFI